MSVMRYMMAARLAGYLGEEPKALAILTDGLVAHPGDSRLLYQRGLMRLITRSIQDAREDLELAIRDEHAAEYPEIYRDEMIGNILDLILERDKGEPAEPAGGSVLVSSRLYLGLARYLLGDYADAAEDFAATRALASEPYQALAALDWEYLSRHRSGQADAAGTLIEGLDWDDYRLGSATSTTVRSLELCYVQRLRLYRGEARPEELLRATSVEGIHVATLGYGVGAWYQYRGYDIAAARTFARILEVGDPTTVGYLAAEAEHARSPVPER